MKNVTVVRDDKLLKASKAYDNSRKKYSFVKRDKPFSTVCDWNFNSYHHFRGDRVVFVFGLLVTLKINKSSKNASIKRVRSLGRHVTRVNGSLYILPNTCSTRKSV